MASLAASSTGTLEWLKEQGDIVRIGAEFDKRIVVRYEDLCDDTNATLARIHEFAGVAPADFEGGFKQGEHHIMGNIMRLKSSRIQRSASRLISACCPSARVIPIAVR